MKKVVSTCLVVFCLGIGIGAGVQLGALSGSTFGDHLIRVDDSAIKPDNLSLAFRDVSRKMANSVVSIQSVVKRNRAQQGRLGPAGAPDLPPEFGQFFGGDPFGGDPFGELFGGPRGGGAQEFVQRGSGTGVIVSESGVVVTNNHVVRDSDQIRVTLNDGRTVEAKLIGADPKTDIAVLKIEAEVLQAATFGDSDLTEVGEWVLAIGSPFELDQTVTAGIISAKSRGDVGIADYEDFLQTDAAINPGNSGGPLVDLKGRVIGINTAIASRSGASMGVGFAIPSNMVRSVVESILETGEVNRGQLGAMISDLTPELADTFGYHVSKGVLVNDVVPKSAAEKAGLKAGDIVTHFNGRQMMRQHQLRSAIARSRPGTENMLTVFRGGDLVEVKVRLGKLNETIGAERPNTERPQEELEFDSRFGISVEALTPRLTVRFGLSPRIKQGVVITALKQGGSAAQFGLRLGDVIVQLGETDVASVADFEKALESVDVERGIRIQLIRGGTRQFLFFQSR